MNGAYTQQELLLLSNFVYIPACLSEKPISEILDAYRDDNGCFTQESVMGAAAGGGMSVPDVRTVFEEMDKKIRDDPAFGQLSVSRKLDEKDVRAICYTGPGDNDPVVVFRGTGGTKGAWSDNFEGAFRDETRIQKLANDFIENDCGIYEDITVTGHSKGGNLAQYVTVKCTDRISLCVSYDGQGFSDDFLEKYAEEIKLASGKITSISAYNDFVNILLTCIAGTCLYVANDSSAAGAHSSVTLLTNNSFDENGDFLSLKDQGVVSKELKRITKRLVSGMGRASGEDKQAFSDIAGSAISLALCTPKDELAEGCLAPTIGKIGARFVKKLSESAITPSVRTLPCAGSVYIDVTSIKGASLSLKEHISRIECVMRNIDVVRSELAYSISAKVCAEHALVHICEDLARLDRSLAGYSEFIYTVAGHYERCELDVASLIGS